MRIKQLKMVRVVIVLTSVAVCWQGGSARAGAWYTQAGWVHQWGRGLSVSGPAPSISSADLSAAPLGGRSIHDGQPTATYPDNSLLIPRTFNDGYVRPDYWTDDAGLQGTDRYGKTWNWGVDSAGQYNYDNGVNPTLAFHIDGQQVVLGGQTTSGGTLDSDMPTDGLEIRVGRTLVAWGAEQADMKGKNAQTSLDLELGLTWFPCADQQAVRQAERTVYGVTETYVYSDYYGSSAGGNWGPLDVPYQGTAADSGSLIPENPTESHYTRQALGTVRDRVTVDGEIDRLRGVAGFSLSRQIVSRWTVYLAPQFVVEFVDLSATRRENLAYTENQTGRVTALSSHSEQADKNTAVPGFLLTGGLDWRCLGEWYVGMDLGWEWLARDPALSVGDDRVSFDLGGGEFSLFVGRDF